ncbi:hypothetical protein HPP92_004240 [Vanilla planifolia]|uniref:Uncharacterized protein n=1 Tax=Vanilla planifolia TaxID=51239 RepID=A0A835RR37_VANPL|nr:hypothetical protein HPP92_004240 [Vanilla planifolia]
MEWTMRSSDGGGTANRWKPRRRSLGIQAKKKIKKKTKRRSKKKWKRKSNNKKRKKKKKTKKKAKKKEKKKDKKEEKEKNKEEVKEEEEEKKVGEKGEKKKEEEEDKEKKGIFKLANERRCKCDTIHKGCGAKPNLHAYGASMACLDRVSVLINNDDDFSMDDVRSISYCCDGPR